MAQPGRPKGELAQLIEWQLENLKPNDSNPPKKEAAIARILSGINQDLRIKHPDMNLPTKIKESMISQFMNYGVGAEKICPALAIWLDLEQSEVESMVFNDYHPQEIWKSLISPEPPKLRPKQEITNLPTEASSYSRNHAAALAQKLIGVSETIYLMRIAPKVSEEFGLFHLVPDVLTTRQKRIVEFSCAGTDPESYRPNALALILYAYKGEQEYLLLDGSGLQTSGIVSERGAIIFTPRIDRLAAFYYPPDHPHYRILLEDVETLAAETKAEDPKRLITFYAVQQPQPLLVPNLSFEDAVLKAQLIRGQQAWWYLYGPSVRHQPPEVIKARLERLLSNSKYANNDHIRKYSKLAATNLLARQNADSRQDLIREVVTRDGLEQFIKQKSFPPFAHDALALAPLRIEEVRATLKRMIDLNSDTTRRHQFAISYEQQLADQLRKVQFMLKGDEAFFEVFDWESTTTGDKVKSRTHISTRHPDIVATLDWYCRQTWERLSPQSKDPQTVGQILRTLYSEASE